MIPASSRRGQHCIRKSFFCTMRRYKTLLGGTNLQHCPVFKLMLRLCS